MAIRYDTLDSMCELVIDCPHSTPKWTDSGVFVIRNQFIKNGTLDLSNPSYTDEENFLKRTKRATPQEGDIVITREAPMGEVCMIPKGLKCCLGQRHVLLRPKKDICNKYLLWALQSSHVQHQISWNEGTGTTVSNLRIPLLKDLKIQRHGKNEEKISKILTDVFEKIEVNKKINSRLEGISQAIFKSWFVDFDPVHAKKLALEKGLSSAQAERAAMAIISGVCGPIDFAENFEEMDKKLSAKLSKMSKEKQEELAYTASLFPSEFEDSELGEIPKGWRESKLGNIAANIRENKKSSELTKDDIYIGLEHIDRKNLFLSRWNSGDVVESNKSAFKQGDILFGKLRPYFHKICIMPFSGVCSTDILVVREREIKYNNFILFTINQEEFVEYANVRSTGTRMPRANWKDMADYKTIIPSEDLLSTFNSIISSFIEKGNSNIKENVSLEALRDTLLPKLLSGEIDLSKIKIDEVHDEKKVRV